MNEISHKPEQIFRANNLVLYKTQPARVIQSGVKIEIALPDKSTLQVRNKDITLLHLGPITDLSHLEELSGELSEACSLLYGQKTNLAEFAELVYGDFSPSSAWAVCKLLMEGLFIIGSVDEIQVRTLEEYEKEVQNRQEKSAAHESWHGFVDRVKKGEINDQDTDRLNELADFASGKSNNGNLMRQLGMSADVEKAHALLLRLGHWDATVNPYVQRLGLSLTLDYPALEAMVQEERLDLTHLHSFAIDDEGSTDPDDAISIDGETLWVHIADAASLVGVDSPVDIHARSQGCTLYLPEKTVTMLPQQATHLLALGLQEISPALSFAITLNESGDIETATPHLTRIKTTRMSYAQAQNSLGSSELNAIYTVTKRFNIHRQEQQALSIHFPEVKIRVIEGKVTMTPLPSLDSHEMVMNAMLMAGKGAADFACAHDIPFPYTTQQPPETIEQPTDMAAMFSYRRKLRPSEVKSSPDQHAGLGLKTYSRVTSPLRRYLDLIAHQQLRAFLTNHPLLSQQELMIRIGASTAVTSVAQKLERLSNLHWTLVYLLQNPNWQGPGIVVDKKDRYSVVIIPELALETRVSISKNLSPNQELMLQVRSVDLPMLTAHFAVL